MSLLVAQQIHHSYGGTQALCDVSLEIEPGEWHALCGENGAGKSTLIKIISGVEPPDRGSVTLEGNPLPMGKGSCGRAGRGDRRSPGTGRFSPFKYDR